MKKVLFSLVFAAITFAASSQAVSVGILNIDTTAVTMDSIPANGIRLIPGTGAFFLKGQYRVNGTTTVFDTDTIPINAGVNSFAKGFPHLQASTTYDVRYVSYGASSYADSMVTTWKTATTKPLPQQPTVFVIDTVPGLPQSGIVFSATSVGDSYVHGVDALTGQVITATTLIHGNTVDTVFITNTPGQHIPEGILIIVPVASMVSASQSANTWPAFDAPNYTLPATGLTIDVVYVDSLKLTAFDTLGNGGPALATTTLHDSVGTSVYSFPAQLVTVTGPTSLSKTSLNPGAKYIIKRKLATINVGQDTASVSSYTLPVPPPTGTIDSTPKTKQTIDIYISMKTNGSWSGSIIDSLILFDGTTVVASVWHPIGTNATGQYHVSVTGLTAGTTHTFSGYIKNVFGRVAFITAFNVTTLLPDPIATADWGIADQYPAKIVWKDVSYNVPAGTATYALVFRKVYPSTTAWDTLPLGAQSGSGTFADITVSPLTDLSSYEFKLVAWNADGIPYENSVVKTVSTLAAQQPKVNDITTDQVTLSIVAGDVIGQANGTNSEESHKLFQIVGGTTNQLQSSAITLVGTDAFTIPYSFALPGSGYYEVRAQVAKVGNINPYGFSKFFDNTALGIKEVTFDEVRSQLVSSAYDGITGQWLAEKMLPLDLLAMFPGRPLIIVPDDPYYRDAFKGKLYSGK